MNPKPIIILSLFCLLMSAQGIGQQDTLDLSANVSSILMNFSWQVQEGDTTTRDFCLLEFALPAEAVDQAYCFQLEGLIVADDKGRYYKANAFAVSAGGQSLHRNYQLLKLEDSEPVTPSFRVRIENPEKDVEYFTLYGKIDMVLPANDPATIQEYPTLEWQSLYESLLAQDIELVFAAQSRSMMEQMANLGSMGPDAQASLNSFLETYSMYLQEPLFPENTNFILEDPHKEILNIEVIGQGGEPIPHKERRSYASGALHLQQQYEMPLSGRERVRVMVATEQNMVSVPVKLGRVVLPW